MNPQIMQWIGLISGLVTTIGGSFEAWADLFGLNQRVPSEVYAEIKAGYDDRIVRREAEELVFSSPVADERRQELDLPPGAFIPGGDPGRPIEDTPEDTAAEPTARKKK